jgi:hypothetical protein
MASKNSMLPIIAILGVGAAIFMSGGKAKASTSQPSVDSNDGLPPEDGGFENESPPDIGGQQDPKDDVWKVEAENTPLTKEENDAIKTAMQWGGIKVDPAYYPSPYNAKKAKQSMLDWKTNLAFWTAYSSTQSPWVLSGKKAAPFKITEGSENANFWAAKWLKIRNHIANLYPDVEINPVYAEGLIK